MVAKPNPKEIARRESVSAYIGIGVLASEMKGLGKFLRGLKDSLNMTIVLVHHNDSSSKLNIDVESLSSTTCIPILSLQDNTLLKPNTIYLSPAKALVEIHQGIAKVLPAKEGSHHRSSIDTFLQSLASDQGSSAIGIVFAGQTSDGAIGLKAIRDAGGLTFAQQPDHANTVGDSQTSTFTGLADYVLQPSEMAVELERYVQHLCEVLKASRRNQLQKHLSEAIPTIAEILLKETNHNFQHYKTNSLVRRILRRMQILKLSSVDEYITILDENLDEKRSLFRELLISVTAFFRDQTAFDSLSNLVIPALFENRTQEDQVRLWVPGCATGEEAYSLAMLCREWMDQMPSPPQVQIFATDIDERALQYARRGIYPDGIQDGISSERLQRFFVKRNKKFHIAKEIRELVLFSTHNLISDPPFSQQDLISCRNLLIYLGPHLQKKLIPLFHYALRPNGYLLLGPSENISSHAELFNTIDSKHRIAQRKATGIRTTNVGANGQGDSIPVLLNRPPQPINDDSSDLLQVMQRIVLDEFAPKSVIVDEDGHILCASADMQKYLTVSGGNFHNNIIKLARSGLRLGLRATIKQAIATRRQITHENLSIHIDGKVQRVMLTVQPMPQVGEEKGLFMVVFHDVGLPVDRGDADATPHDSNTIENESDTIIQQLERELRTTREDLERSIQDMETANEELKASNEELLAMNEELHSANEELESSKDEVRMGIESTEKANRHLENLFRSTQIATIFLDAAGNIQWFTPAATEIYNLIQSDIGRPIEHLTHKLSQMPPMPSPGDWKSNQKFIENETQSLNGRWFLRRILPYLSADQPDGLIITFIDVTDQKRAAMRLATEHQVTKRLAESDSFDSIASDVVESIRSTLEAECCVLWRTDTTDSELYCYAISVRSADAAMEKFANENYQRRFKQGIGFPGRTWQSLTSEWIENLSEDSSFTRKSGIQAGLQNGMAMPIVVGAKFYGVIEVFTRHLLEKDESLMNMLQSIGLEIGQSIRRNHLDEQLREEESRKSAILESALDSIITMDTSGRIIDFNPAAERTFGHSQKEVFGKPLAETIIPPEFRDSYSDELTKYLTSGESAIIGKRIELMALRSNGETFPVELAISATKPHAKSEFFTAYLRDITEHKRFLQTIHDRDEKIVALLNSTAEGIFGVDANGICTFANASCARLLGYSSADKFIGKQMHLLVHHGKVNGEGRSIANFPIYESLRSGGSDHIDNEVFWRADGSSFDVECWSYPIMREDQITGCVVTFLDVTQRREADKELRDREGRFASLVEASSQIVWTTNAVGEVVEDSPSWRTFTGQTIEQWKGKGWVDAIHPEDRHAILEKWKDVIAVGAPLNHTYRLKHVSGAWRWTQVHAIAQRDDEGNVTRWVGMNSDITDRKQWELELTYREAHLRRVIDNMIGFVGVLDVDGTLLEANATALIAGGMKREDVMGKHFCETDWWNYDENAQSQLREAINKVKEGQTIRYDTVVRMAGDTRMSIDFMLAPVYDELGNITHIIPSGVDISQRLLAEEALSENRQRLSLAMEAARMGSYEWDILSDVVTWDKEHLAITGMPNTQMTGADFLARIHPNDAIPNQIAIQNTLVGKSDYEIDFRFIRPDGETRWLAARGRIVESEDGKSRKFVGLNWDITEQKLNAEAIRMGEARLQRIIDGSSIGIAFARTSGDVIRANDSALHILGTDRNSFEKNGFRWLESVRKQDQTKASSIIGQLRQSGRMLPREMYLERADGTQMPVMISSISVDISDDEHVVFLVDLTQQKEIEKSLEEARMVAETANAAKSAFIANMSHEIRTPMTAVLGYADLLSAREDDPEKSDFLQTIKRNGNFLLEIINDILDLSKIEAGKMEIHNEPFHLSRILNDVKSMMDLRARDKDLVLEVELDSSVPPVIASDPKRLKQILINLVGNAIKFTNIGSVRLVVQHLPEPNPKVQFSIIDTGIGISKQQLTRLFLPFSQGDSTVNRAFGGTGLGLAISQRLAEILGGAISVQSEFGKGSSFTFTIAIDSTVHGAVEPNLSISSIEQTLVGAQLPPLDCTVLVVDDRRDVRFLTKHLLTKAGATVELAEDGQHAIEIIANVLTGNGAETKSSIDLVLLDMQMPRLDGYETAAQLRKMGFVKPIIALTADAMHGDMKRCLQSGCDSYLSKPIDSQALHQMVLRFTNGCPVK